MVHVCVVEFLHALIKKAAQLSVFMGRTEGFAVPDGFARLYVSMTFLMLLRLCRLQGCICSLVGIPAGAFSEHLPHTARKSLLAGTSPGTLV